VFFEKLPGNYVNNTVFIDRFFAFDNLSKKGVSRGNFVREDCMYRVENMGDAERADLQGLCSLLPKCLGYIEGVCLIGHDALGKPLVPDPGSIDEYYEKRRTHRVFDEVVEYWELVVSLVILLLGAMLVFPSNGTLYDIYMAEVDVGWFYKLLRELEGR
jgi:hypothetical protein